MSDLKRKPSKPPSGKESGGYKEQGGRTGVHDACAPSPRRSLWSRVRLPGCAHTCGIEIAFESLEVGTKLRGGLVAELAVFLERLRDNGVELGRKDDVALLGWRRLAI